MAACKGVEAFIAFLSVDYHGAQLIYIGLRLGKRGAVARVVDADEQISLFDGVAFFNVAFEQVAFYSGANEHFAHTFNVANAATLNEVFTCGNLLHEYRGARGTWHLCLQIASE